MKTYAPLLVELFLIVNSISDVHSWVKSLPSTFSGGRYRGGGTNARALICEVDNDERLDYEILA